VPVCGEASLQCARTRVSRRLVDGVRAALLACVLAAMLSPAYGQSIEWTRRIGTIAMDEALGVAADASGIYAVGYADGELPDLDQVGKQDAYIRKFDAAGNVLWTRQFGSIFDDAASAVAADPSGIYVAGAVGPDLADFTNSNRLDIFLRKYDPSGNLIWSRRVDSVGTPQNDSALSVAVSGGAVYIAGYTHGTLPGQLPQGGYDAFVSKYDLNGAQQWTRQFGTKGIDIAVGVAANSSGIFVLGETDGALPGQSYSGGGYDIFLRKYDVNGGELWTKEFGTAALEFAGGVAADSSGVYITGATAGALPGQANTSGYDAFVRKYDSSGAELWTRQFSASSDVLGYGVAVNGASLYVTGNVVGLLAGQIGAGGFNEDTFVRKYDTSGNLVWTRQFGTPNRDTAAAITAIASGIYVAGATPRVLLSPTTTGDWDGLVSKLVESSATAPIVAAGGVVNAADLARQASPVAGSVASLFGMHFEPASQDPVVVEINGIAAPVFSIADTQINFQVPWELEGAAQATVTVTVDGITSLPVNVALAPLAPGIFSSNSAGTGQGSILIASASSSAAPAGIAAPAGTFSGARPVTRGETISIYATGLGAVSNQPPTGAPAAINPLSLTVTQPSVLIGGVAGTVQFSGLAPGFVGLYQLNVQIPPDAPSGAAVPVLIDMAGTQSNTVTIAVQ
jgi:uncharacterized protein (TIGR03437 family)